ncbi:MAG TPA: acetyl-CoA carboxylase biotin carboxyl carrier protein [Firmicutes bacterium]|nr:acetyl-CoA carboxylase biotin carboxyl carrier protein [Bacillota bacterium]
MDFKEIKELIAQVNSTEIAELEIKAGDFKIRIRKKEPSLKSAQDAPLQPVEVKAARPAVEKENNLLEVCAPMVGTFYRAPAPDEPPYVEVEDQVREGQVLFIIEAMKMMNEIECELQGVIKKFLVENGAPVEYGQPLLLIEPLG